MSWPKIGAAFRTTAAIESRLRLRDRSEFNGSVIMLVLMRILGRDREFSDSRSLATNRYFGPVGRVRSGRYLNLPDRILQSGSYWDGPGPWRASYGTGMSGTVGTLTPP